MFDLLLDCDSCAMQILTGYYHGQITGQIIIPNVPLNLWGWQIVGGNLLLVWSTIPQASAACAELTICNCKKKCSGKCKCSKANLRCTSLCLCVVTATATQRNILGFLVNCEVWFILYFHDELSGSYIFIRYS